MNLWMLKKHQTSFVGVAPGVTVAFAVLTSLLAAVLQYLIVKASAADLVVEMQVAVAGFVPSIAKMIAAEG